LIDLPAYDAYGTKLNNVAVQSILPIKARSIKDVPERYLGTYGIAKSKAAIIFDKQWLGSDGFRVVLVAAIAGSPIRNIEIEVPMLACRYRQSTVVGQRATGDDAEYTVAVGRVVGCKLEGEWWLRAVAIFGGGSYAPGIEGFIDRVSGEITLAAIPSGTRHLVILGHGKDPIRTIAVDFVLGQQNVIPVFRLSPECR
jgi:hypothetical protein